MAVVSLQLTLKNSTRSVQVLLQDLPQNELGAELTAICAHHWTLLSVSSAPFNFALNQAPPAPNALANNIEA